MMDVRCTAVKLSLDTVGSSAIAGPIASHIDSCQVCSAEMEWRRSITASLHGLPTDEFAAPINLHPDVMSSLGPVAVPDLEPRNHRAAVATAAVATAAVATAAGTAVLLHLRRTRIA